MVMVNRPIGAVEAPATRERGALVRKGLVLSLAGVNPARLIPAALRSHSGYILGVRLAGFAAVC
jgi:hypothetical protein